MVNGNILNLLTVCKKMSSNLFKNKINYKLFTYIYIRTGFGIKQARMVEKSLNQINNQPTNQKLAKQRDKSSL